MRKFLIASLAVILVLGMIGGAFAAFTDTETSTGNIFTAGTLELEIYHPSLGWGNVGPVAEWTMTDMAPGINTDIGVVHLREAGSITPHHLMITCYYIATEGPPTGDMDLVDQDNPSFWDDFAKYIEIVSFDYYDGTWHIKYNNISGFTTTGSPPTPSGWVPADWQITNSDGVSGISLCDLFYDPLTNLPPPDEDIAGSVHFEMSVRFHQDAGSDLQGDTLTATITFTLHQ